MPEATLRPTAPQSTRLSQVAASPDASHPDKTHYCPDPFQQDKPVLALQDGYARQRAGPNEVEHLVGPGCGRKPAQLTRSEGNQNQKRSGHADQLSHGFSLGTLCLVR